MTEGDVQDLVDELEKLAERWHRKVNTPCVANECAEELREVLENNVD